jgi:aerobic-type carbon monoxide dehydrogenase small subunit (CoxS/CutS family)
MVELTINGETQRVDTGLDIPLPRHLRDELGLTGTPLGCGAGLRGCCTVHVNNEATRACSIALGDLNGSCATMIEQPGANTSARTGNCQRRVRGDGPAQTLSPARKSRAQTYSR